MKHLYHHFMMQTGVGPDAASRRALRSVAVQSTFRFASVLKRPTLLKTLPLIMVAPNGARRGKPDHPALPVTIAETVAAAKACFAEGAGALHAHVRDRDGTHTLDAGLYRELIAEMARAVPAMAVQITTEAVGRYTPAEQRRLVRAVRPRAVSVALREMLPDRSEIAAARRFYRFCADEGIAVQHILYTPEEVQRLFDHVRDGTIPAGPLQLLFVLGRYTSGQESAVSDLNPFLAALAEAPAAADRIDWALCAFGVAETDCLVEAVRRGGKARIGFENSLWHSDGRRAADNAARVRALRRALDALFAGR